MTRSKSAVSVWILALLLVSCSASSQGQSTSTSAAATTSQVPTTVAPTTTSTTPITTSTVQIVSPLPPPKGAVIAAGEEWELTDQEFSDLVDFTAGSMQQSFPEPVAVEVLGTNGVTDLSEPGVEYITAQQWDLLKALGLTADDQLSLAEVNELRRQRVRGTCCSPAEGALTVQVEDVGSEELTKLVIVHELVHALLTQRPPRGIVPNEAFDEPVDVVTAAAEGVPQWVALRYHDSLTEAERDAMAEEMPIIRAIDFEAGIPESVAEVLTFGYIHGPILVEAVGAAGVSRPYDQIVDRFPATSEQVLFPAAYLEQELPVTVPPPAAPSGAVVTASGRLGSFYLMMLAKTVIDEEVAQGFVRPWAGDGYVLWKDSDRACVAVDVVMDDGASALALSDVLQTWAANLSEASVEVSGVTMSIESCS